MTGSLRFRLPALFLQGIVLSGIVAALIALRLFQSYTRDQSRYRAPTGGPGSRSSTPSPRCARSTRASRRRARRLQARAGHRRQDLLRRRARFPGERWGSASSGVRSSRRGRGHRAHATFEFVPPGQARTYLAAAGPLRLRPTAAPFGALVVAKPKTDLRRRWLPLLGRLALAFLVGASIAGVLSWYLSRRITGPVGELSDATDEIAAGHYDVARRGAWRW